MDLKLFLTVFGAIFLAELGDKTQLVVMAFAAESPESLISILSGAVIALFLTSLIGIFLGGVIAKYVPADIVSYIAGGLFVVIGVSIILKRVLGG